MGEEALNNAQKHAQASWIRVRAIATTHTLRLEIADDGVRAHAGQAPGGGLTGLRCRVEALGSSLWEPMGPAV